MSNHIKTKYLGLTYAPINVASFATKTPELMEALRGDYPSQKINQIQDINIDIDADGVATRLAPQGEEVLMVDADGKWGVTIGNLGVRLTVDEYVAYDSCVSKFKALMDVVAPILKIDYFTVITLRNINLFEEITNSPNRFTHINEDRYWGRQELRSLEKDYSCGGAATKHIYHTHDFKMRVQLTSSVVIQGQTFVPRPEWPLWEIRGEVPAAKKTHLMIDIAAESFQYPLDEPSQKNKMTRYEWSVVENELNKLHDNINQIYGNIVKE